MDKIDWLNYLFFVDFSADEAALATIPTGVVSDEDANTLAVALSHYDTGEYRGEWTAEAGAAYSVAGATVEVNGANSTEYSTNSTRNRALSLVFPEDSKSPPAGTRIFLTYNVPATTGE